MASTPNYSWTMPDSTDLVKDLPADFATFGNAVDSTVYSNANAAIAKTLIDAKGDLIVGSATDTASKLSVGTDGQYLKANSSATNGVEWGDVSAGGMTLISETTASALSSLSLSSIPQTYKSLLLVWIGIQHSATGSVFDIRLNASSGATDYQGHYFWSSVSSAAVEGSILANRTSLMQGTNAAAFGKNATANSIYGSCSGFFRIDNYLSTTKYKKLELQSSWYDDTGDYRSVRYAGNFEKTSAVTSIDITRLTGSGTFSNLANTSIRLYGLS